MVRRYTIDLGEAIDKLLNDLAEKKGTSKSEIIRRAITSYAYLDRQTAHDRKVSITTHDDTVVKDVVLP